MSPDLQIEEMVDQGPIMRVFYVFTSCSKDINQTLFNPTRQLPSAWASGRAWNAELKSQGFKKAVNGQCQV